MKQLVSAKDMSELSPVAKRKLHQWLEEKNYGSVFDGKFVGSTQLSIGQQMEFLDDHAAYLYFIKRNAETWSFEFTHVKYEYEELCDALFAAVKEILEQKN